MAQLLGIDIGGTKIGVCLGDGDGNVIERRRIATDPATPPGPLLAEALRWADETARRRGASPAALGVASPGPLDPRAGRMLEVPNMPGWQGFALRDHLAGRSGLPTAVMNDANASVLAEWYWGAARGFDNAIFLTMSTGMGAGLLLDGRLFEGPLGLAGEIGHVRLDEEGPVGFGKRGSVEGFLSGPGLAQLAAGEVLARRQRGEATALARDGELTPEAIFECAAGGDAAARAVVERYGARLGGLVATLVDVLNPDVVIFGTIGTANFAALEPIVRRVLDREAIAAAAEHVRIVPSGLADRGDRTALAIARHLIDASAPQ